MFDGAFGQVAASDGQSYHDYIREHILRAASMSNSDFYTKPQWISGSRIAHPYSTQSSAMRVDVIDKQLFIGFPAGNSFSNAADLIRFTKALLGNKLLNPVYTRLTLSPKVAIEPLGTPRAVA